MNLKQTKTNTKKPIHIQETKLWSLQYILVLAAIGIISFTMTLFMPLMPIYIKAIGGNVSLAGLVVSIYTFSALLCRPFFAVLIDRYGRKPILVIGFILLVIGCFSYRFAAVISILMIVRAVHGIGYSASSNATSTIVADIIPRERRSQGIGYYGFVTAASLALGPAFGLLVMKNADIKTAFTVAAALAFLGLILSFFVSYEKKNTAQYTSEDEKKNSSIKEGSKKSKINFGYEKTALPASLIMFFVAFAYSGIVTFLPTYAGTLGIEHISIYFITYAIVLLITRIIVDHITKKKDIRIVLMPGMILMVVAFILLGTVKTLPYLLVAAVFYAIGFGSVQPTLNAIVVSLCMPSRRGAANSTFFSSMDLGIGLGAFVWGLVSQQFGYSSIYFGCIVFMVLAMVSYLILFIRKKGIKDDKKII